MNNISNFIKKSEKKNFIFTPDNKFYSKVGINKKRWGMIINSKTSPTYDELCKIATFFEVNVKELV